MTEVAGRSAAYGPDHQCTRRGQGIRKLNGHTEPGDPDLCGGWIFWDGASGSWRHVLVSLDRDHEAIWDAEG